MKGLLTITIKRAPDDKTRVHKPEIIRGEGDAKGHASSKRFAREEGRFKYEEEIFHKEKDQRHFFATINSNNTMTS